jgi:5-methylthioadenosine/S-adenosylhomocysteine deaminase
MYYFEDHIAQATAEIGLRAVCAQTVYKFPSPDARFYEESLASTREFIQKWNGHPLIVPAVGPHAPYTCTPEILQASAALQSNSMYLHIHWQKPLSNQIRSEFGMPVIPYVKTEHLDAKVIAAHCVYG